MTIQNLLLGSSMQHGPLRGDWANEVLAARYRVEDNDGYRIFEYRDNHDTDVKRMLEELLPARFSPLELVSAMDDDGWSRGDYEKELHDFYDRRGELMRLSLLNENENLILCDDSFFVLPKNLTFSSIISHEVKALAKACKNNDEKAIQKELANVQSNLVVDNTDFLWMIEAKFQLQTDSPYHADLDSLIKTNCLWLSNVIPELPCEDKWLPLKLEWFLCGGSINGGNASADRLFFRYFRRDLNIRLEEFIENIFVSDISSQELEFLILAFYARNVSVFHPEWPLSLLVTPTDGKFNELFFSAFQKVIQEHSQSALPMMKEILEAVSNFIHN